MKLLNIAIGLLLSLSISKADQDESTDVFVSPNQAVGTGTLLSKIEKSAFFGALSKYPEVVSMLESEGPWSIILPSDDAIANLPAMSEEEMADVVLFHVMEGYLYSLDVTSFATNKFTMKNGKVISSSRLPASFKPAFGADVSNIVIADIFATNGVVHQVDAVLKPPVDPSEETDVAGAEKESSAFALRFAMSALVAIFGVMAF